MKTRNLALAAAVSAALAAPATTVNAGEMEWFGSVYAKFLDGDRRFEHDWNGDLHDERLSGR